MSCTDDTCGTGGWGGPKPGDPDNNVSLTATATFGGVNVAWTYPATNPWAVAYVKLYRGTTSDFGYAVEIASVSGDRYYDRLDNGGIEYFYWIRIISVYGSVGNLIGPAVAKPKGRIEDMIEDLTGKIDAGALSQALKAKLDEISILNTNLLNEITSREDGETTLAEALDAVSRGVAEAMTFIAEEINSRVTSESAIIEQINLLAATLGDQYAAVIQTMRVEIDQLTGVTRAMWTAQVNVNGLIGGFGMINDGLTVEAGFDVDRFWVGRTNANKRKPFIIENDITYIDTAMIRSLTFSKMTDEGGTFIVQNGRIQGEYLEVKQANIDNLRVRGAQIDNLRVGKAQIDNLIVGTEEIYPEAATTARWGQGNPSCYVEFNVPVGQYWESMNTATWAPGTVNNSNNNDGMNEATSFSLSGVGTVIVPDQLRMQLAPGGDNWERTFFPSPMSRASVIGHGAGYHRIDASSTGNGAVILTTLLRKR